MKSLFLSVALFAATANVFAQGLKSIPIGSPMPNAGLALRSTEGNPVSLQQAKTDKGLLVMFSCNTCPYVVKSQERTAQAIAMAKKAGVGMVIINSNEGQRAKEDSYEAMQKYAAAQKYTVPYVVDENSMLANEFGATRTPEVFLFDKAGMLVYHGAMEDNPSEPGKSKEFYLAQAVKEMAAGTPVTTPETKSIGCGIKRMMQ